MLFISTPKLKLICSFFVWLKVGKLKLSSKCVADNHRSTQIYTHHFKFPNDHLGGNQKSIIASVHVMVINDFTLSDMNTIIPLLYQTSTKMIKSRDSIQNHTFLLLKQEHKIMKWLLFYCSNVVKWIITCITITFWNTRTSRRNHCCKMKHIMKLKKTAQRRLAWIWNSSHLIYYWKWNSIYL